MSTKDRQPQITMLAAPSFPRAAVLIAFILAVSFGPTILRAETSASLPPLLAPTLERPSPELKTGMAPLAPFLRDATLTLHLRTFYYDGTRNKSTENEAWTGGGWLGYRSGWLLDTFGIGVTTYGSAPFYAPADKDGTFLLKPGQKGYVALGEAYGALRYHDYILLKGYRQLVDQDYINPSDIRMTPYTFEGITLAGKIDVIQYLTGYLWKIKPRNADTFISMAEQAGAKGSNGGVGLIGVQLAPTPSLRIDVSNQYGIDTFNTAYAKVDYRYRLNRDWAIGLGAEFTDQRAVGDALVANAAVKKWSTQVGGARAQLIYRDLTLTGAFSITGSGNTIQNPWGTYPGYLALIDAPASKNFARANGEGMADRRGLRLFEAGRAGPHWHLQLRVGDRGHRPSNAGGRTRPERVQLQDRLPPSLARLHHPSGPGAHRAQRLLRSERRWSPRSSNPRDSQLGVGHSCSCWGHEWEGCLRSVDATGSLICDSLSRGLVDSSYVVSQLGGT